MKNNFTVNDSYHDGYQARQKGKPLSSYSGITDRPCIDAFRAGWFDADHDLIHTTKRMAKC